MSGSSAAPRQSSAPETSSRDPLQSTERRLLLAGDAREDAVIQGYILELRKRKIPESKLREIEQQMADVLKKYQLEACKVTSVCTEETRRLKSELNDIVFHMDKPVQAMFQWSGLNFDAPLRRKLATEVFPYVSSTVLVKLLSGPNTSQVSEIYFMALAASVSNPGLESALASFRSRYPRLDIPKQVSKWWENAGARELLIAIQTASNQEALNKEEEAKLALRRFRDLTNKNWTLDEATRPGFRAALTNASNANIDAILSDIKNASPAYTAELFLALWVLASPGSPNRVKFLQYQEILWENTGRLPGIRSMTSHQAIANAVWEGRAAFERRNKDTSQGLDVVLSMADNSWEGIGEKLGRKFTVFRNNEGYEVGDGVHTWSIRFLGYQWYDYVPVSEAKEHLSKRQGHQINWYYFANYIDYALAGHDASMKMAMWPSFLYTLLWGGDLGKRKALSIAAYWKVDFATGKIPKNATTSEEATPGMNELTDTNRPLVARALEGVVNEYKNDIEKGGDAGKRIYMALKELKHPDIDTVYTPETLAKAYVGLSATGLLNFISGLAGKLPQGVSVDKLTDTIRDIDISRQESLAAGSQYQADQLRSKPKSRQQSQELARLETVARTASKRAASARAVAASPQARHNENSAVASGKEITPEFVVNNARLAHNEASVQAAVAQMHALQSNPQTRVMSQEYLVAKENLDTAQKNLASAAVALESTLKKSGIDVKFTASEYLATNEKYSQDSSRSEKNTPDTKNTPAQTTAVLPATFSSNPTSTDISALTPSIRYDVPSASGVTIERSHTGDGATVRFGEREVFCASPEQVSHTIEYGRYMEDLGLSMMAGDFHRALADSGIPFDIRDGIDDAKKSILLKIVGMRFWWKGAGVKELGGAEFIVPPDGNLTAMETSIRQYANMGGKLDISSRALALWLLQPGETSIPYSRLKTLAASMVSSLHLAR